MKILNESQIVQKIRRLAYEILEQNYEEKSILLLGINRNGLHFAQLLQQSLESITKIPVELAQVKLNPADPLADEIELDRDIKALNRKNIIVVDDVANTGRTIFYAMKPLQEVLPRRVEVAVLIDRKHKAFPINVDYVGLSLATTLREDIDVQIREVKEMAVYLN